MTKQIIIYSTLTLFFSPNISSSQDYWELVNSPDSVYIFDIAVDGDGRVYLACPFSSGYLTGIFRSDDNCETWHRKVEGMDTTFSPHTRSITLDYDNNLISGCDSRIYRSSDFGESWLEVYHATPASYSFNIAEFGYDSIVLVGGESTYGIVRSGDNGLNWLPVLDFANFDPDYPEAITGICFGPDGNIYVCSRAYIGGSGSVYISEDLGFTWSVFFNDGFSQFFSIDFDLEGRLLVGSNGLYRYDFTFSLWEHIPYNIAPFDILVLPDTNIYLACDGSGPGIGGVALSQDGGEIYELINSGMNFPNAKDFAIDAIGRILVSGNSNILYRSYDTLITSIENKEKLINQSHFKIYPNPSSGKINITVSEHLKVFSIEILDLTGRKIYSLSGNNIFTFTIDMSAYKCGIYIVQLKSDHYEDNIKIYRN